MTGDAVSNTQSQVQQQTVTVSIQSSSDPELEQRIFSQVHSAGRQLKTISAVIEVMLAALQSDPNFAMADPAIATFREMQHDILVAKSLRDPEKLVSQLAALQQADAAKFAIVRDELRDFLKDK